MLAIRKVKFSVTYSSISTGFMRIPRVMVQFKYWFLTLHSLNEKIPELWYHRMKAARVRGPCDVCSVLPELHIADITWFNFRQQKVVLLWCGSDRRWRFNLSIYWLRARTLPHTSPSVRPIWFSSGSLPKNIVVHLCHHSHILTLIV